MTILATLLVWAIAVKSAQASPEPNESSKVGIISDPNSINGGFLPTSGSGPTGNYGTEFTFTNVPAATVNAATLSAFDTVVLNVASSEMGCNVGTLTSSQKSDLVSFNQNGGKLIIYDSECPPQDYSWLPFPFTTSNPGATGSFTGSLNIVEENLLGKTSSGDPHFIDTGLLTSQTDAVGDMNVLTTQDPKLCLHMSGTNVQGTTGATHVYWLFGSGVGIYNGFDMDSMGASPDTDTGPNNMNKVFLQELQQPRDGTGLACAVPVTGIGLSPATATNPVGSKHTVTATVTSNGSPVPGALVSFSVSGANAGASGTCNPADCKTDASGQVTFTYTGTNAGDDTITASVTLNGSTKQATAQKKWTTTGGGGHGHKPPCKHHRHCR